MWAIPAGMAALGAVQGINNEKRMKKHDQFRKAAIQYSPWTDMQDPGAMQLPGMIEKGVQGGATGAMLAYGPNGIGEGVNKPDSSGMYSQMMEQAPPDINGELPQLQAPELGGQFAPKRSPGSLGSWTLAANQNRNYGGNY